MGYNQKYGCPYPTDAREAKHMKIRQQENLKRCLHIPAESWFEIKLTKTNLKWSRQSIWGTRIFDFWNHSKGIAVEIDGLTHNKEYDARHDKYNLERSGILVLRVPNFDEQKATEILNIISKECSWNERRAKYGIKLLTNQKF